MSDVAVQVRTLVVDDEAAVRFSLSEILRRSGHSVAMAANGEEALARLRESAFDLIVLDLRLGGRVDGMKVLEAVKWRWPDTTVVILTAYGSLESAIAAIREGVDGYLLKPVEPGEFRHAVHEALARRARAVPAGDREEEKRFLHWGTLRVDPEQHVVTMGERPLDLTAREFSLLAHLVEHAPRVVSPQELVWVVQEYECEDVREAREIVKWYIYRLRRKVEEDPSKPQYIVNVRGVGYRMGGVE